ncbi:MAG: hypothetical protein ACK4L7_09330, partial [Flavobacteriales bacterium]
MSITTAHSPWLATLCLALGIGLAWWLYRRQPGREGLGPRLSLALGALRAAAIALIAFFLLEPMLRLMVREVRRPVVALLHDGSRSLLLAGDTAAQRGAYADELRALQERLGEAFQVRAFTYGAGLREGLHFGQEEEATDLALALREVGDRLGGPDLAAVIIDGDGIINRGRDPRLEAERLAAPVHVIALGDTTVRPDLAVQGVDHNRLCFLGNEAPVRARIMAHRLKGRRARITLKQGGRELASHEVAIAADPFLHESAFTVRPEEPGVRRYTIEVAALDDERGTANNTMDFFIEVLDGRQKVLVLGASPHPDLGALRLALGGMEGYEVELAMAQEFAGAPEAYDLLVLHQLPGPRADVGGLLERARAKGIPVLYVLGGQSGFEAYNAQQAGVRVSGARPAITDA